MDKLKFGAREGIADLGFTAEQILNLIPKQLQQKELFSAAHSLKLPLFLLATYPQSHQQ
jgi:hypothetical protein